MRWNYQLMSLPVSKNSWLVEAETLSVLGLFCAGCAALIESDRLRWVGLALVCDTVLLGLKLEINCTLLQLGIINSADLIIPV